MHLEAQRFPTLFRACQDVAAAQGERCTSEMFARQIKRYRADDLQRMENKLWVLTPERRTAVVAAFVKMEAL